MEKYRDSSLSAEERAEDLISRMGLDEKMGQVVCFWPRLLPTDEETFEEQYPQGAGMLAMTYMRMIKTRQGSVDFQRKWQEKVMAKSTHHIPAICHLEGICGATVQEAISFPNGLARGASFDPELEEKIGEIVGREESAMGTSQVFAPVLDINTDPRNGRMGETYGEDPTLASAMGAAYVRGVQKEHGTEQKIEAVAKHFAGFHGSAAGIESSNFEVSDRTYHEVYLKPFQACMSEAGLRGVMPCYTPINGEGTSASKKILTRILRGTMGFDGLVVSDYTGITKLFERNKLFDSREEAAYRSLAAGMDFETPLKRSISDELVEQFRRGERDMAVLDAAVYRILVAKFRMGLFEHPFAMSEEELDRLFVMEGDAEISKKSARESMVLIKNNGILPIKSSPKVIAVIGPHAKSARFFFGSYTHYSTAEGNYAMQHEKDRTAAGLEVETIGNTPIQRSNDKDYEELLHHQKPECRSLLEELERRYPESRIVYSYGYDVVGDDDSHYIEAIENARDADLVILTLGGKHGTRKIATMGEGTDSASVNLPQGQEKFITAIKELGKPMIGVHFDGRPISSDAADRYLDAILEAWSPSEFGAEAVVDILSGTFNPCGKLPVSVVYNAGQIPLSYRPMNGSSFTPYTSIGVYGSYLDCPHDPRYSFGHGLSYTDFEYSELEVKVEKEGVVVSLSVENTGPVDGTEVVLLFAGDENASVIRPVRELVGFGRVELRAGEKKRVSTFVRFGQLAFYQEDGVFISERGWFTLEAGASAGDIRLSDRFMLQRDMTFEEKSRGFYSLFS